MKLNIFKTRVRRYIRQARTWHKAFTLVAQLLKESNDREIHARQRLGEAQRRLEEQDQNFRIMAARNDATYQDAIRSRFYELVGADEGDHHPGRFLRPITTRQASELVDMADCYESNSQLLYLGDDGQLLPVTVGGMQRHEPDPDGNGDLPFHYASAPFIAGGEVVGYVHYTDH